MKKFRKPVVLVLLITFLLLLLCGCNKSKVYDKVRDYIDANAFITPHFAMLDASSTLLVAYYDEDTGVITFFPRISGATDISFSIEVHEKKNTFLWKCEYSSYVMEGENKLSEITKDTRRLSYSFSNAPFSIESLLSESAALYLNLLLYSINDNFEGIGVSVIDLGFKNFK